MINLSFKNSSLVIYGNDNDEIYNWQHRMFLKVSCGYDFDEKRQKYTFSAKDNLHDVLLSTINYFKEEGLLFEEDRGIKQLLKQIDNDQIEFEEAKKAGLSVKGAKNSKIEQEGLVRVLTSYQLKSLEHLLSVKNGANFSVPGSGKTTVIFAAYEKLRRENVIEKLLVVGPRSCFLPWEEEANACFGRPIRTARLTGIKQARESLYFQSENFDLFLCTYQTATNDLNEIIQLCQKHKMYVVVDESHNIKKFDGGTWSDTMLSISKYAIRRAILSGTPIPNDLSDLWTQITFLWPGEQVLGNKVEFQYKIEERQDNVIKKLIKPFLYRVTKSQLNLPEPEFIRKEYLLQPYQQKIYSSLSIKILQELKFQPFEIKTLREWRKAKMVRLIQTASNPTLLAKYSEEFNIPPISGEGTSIIDLIEEYPKYETPTKFTAVLQIVTDLLSKGEKVVIWTTFIHNIEMLMKILAEFKPLCIYGAIPRDESEDTEINREQQIRIFKSSISPQVLLANPAACAESISLHKVCHNAIYLDRTFNCGQYLQSLDRIHRIGLAPEEKVTYHILIAKNTIDETIDRRLIEKEERMRRLLDDEIPVGTFQTDNYQLAKSDEEEIVDFQETINDLNKNIDREIEN